MAIRTISNAGGNYNSTSTWVESVVPTSNDDVIATSSSGQLTVNVNSACKSFNFTNYTNTLTMNGTLTANGSSSTMIFVSGMTINGSSNIIIGGALTSITTNNKIIPNLIINGTKTLNDNLNVINISPSNNAPTLNGNSVNCSGNWDTSFWNVAGTSVINLISTGGTVSLGSYAGTGGLNLNGNFSGSTIGIGLSTNTVLNINSGSTLSKMRIKQLSSPITLNTNGLELETFDTTSAANAVVNLPSEFKVKYLNIQAGAYVPTSQYAITFAGAGALNVTDSMNLNSTLVNNGATIEYKPVNLLLNTGVTHSINTLNMNGFASITTHTLNSATLGKFRSASSGIRANVNLLNPSQSIISSTDIIDINFTGPIVYTLGSGGTITNSVNVTNIPLISPGSGSGSTSGGGAWTFVN